MGGACGMHGRIGNELNILASRVHLKDLGLYGRIILKIILYFKVHEVDWIVLVQVTSQ